MSSIPVFIVMTMEDLTKLSEKKFRELQNLIQDSCTQELMSISKTSKLGITVEKVQIERFQLQNEAILVELESITKAQLSANRERAQGEYQVVKAEQIKRAREREAEANASVSKFLCAHFFNL